MRIGLHYGPVQKVFDRVQKRHGYMGVHVTRAARIEPVTKAGMVYVSEAFAAALAVDGDDDLVCDYRGRRAHGKKSGKAPLYELRRRRRSGARGRAEERAAGLGLRPSPRKMKR